MFFLRIKGMKHDFRIEEILAGNQRSESEQLLLLPVSHHKAANAGVHVVLDSKVQFLRNAY